MAYRNGNYTAFYVAEPFHPSLGANATKDFQYYNTLRMWKGADATFPLSIRTTKLTASATAAIGNTP